MLWSDIDMSLGEVGEVGEGSSEGEASDMAVPSSFLLAAASRSRRFLFFFWDARFLLSIMCVVGVANGVDVAVY